MLDIQLIRNDLDAVAARLATRGVTLDVVAFRALEEQRKHAQVRTQELQARRNASSKQIGELKRKGEDTAVLMAEMGTVGDDLKKIEVELDAIQAKLTDMLLTVPNLPHSSVPAGKSADDNVEVRRIGEPRKFDFQPKDHVDVGTGLGMLDFDTAAKISGARFTLMQGPLARLHRVLAQFMLDVHSEEHNYIEVYAPYIVNDLSLRSTGQLPKF
ncbi:MAG TPA: serine--tRNA ligase, partial [Burkholderiales bacterium]